MTNVKYAKVVDGLIADIVMVDASNVPDWIAAEYIPEEDVVLRDKTQAELDAEAVLAAERDAARIQRIKSEFDSQSSVNKVLLKISFLQENRIRVLEGKPKITAAQFRTWVDNQIA